MKKNTFRILIVIGQSLMLLYFVALFFQTFILMANLSLPLEEQLGKIINGLMVFSASLIVLMIFSLVYSCYPMPRFFRKRGFVTEVDGIAIGICAFGQIVLFSYSNPLGTVWLGYIVLAAGYLLQLYGFRAFYKKRLEAEKIEKSSESPEVKLAMFHRLHEHGYLSDEEMSNSIKEWTPKP